MSYRHDGSLLWPADDVHCAKERRLAQPYLETVYPHCQGFDVAVQAGGNCGVWPYHLSLKFRYVYTFEPDPVNFRCLCANAPGENIFKFNAALGCAHETIDLVRNPVNIGAHYVGGPGPIPTMRVDDLSLPACDLIYLDIEGYELRAIRGARETILAHKPVVAIEEAKGCPDRYGSTIGDAERFVIEHFGYKVVERNHIDVVMVPC